MCTTMDCIVSWAVDGLFVCTFYIYSTAHVQDYKNCV